MEPQVSYFVPCYNYGRFVAQAVDSLLGQTFQNLEVIVIDDCSSDDSQQVLSRYDDDPRVRIIRHTVNRGHILSYNEGIDLAKGKYIGLLSADDFLLRQDAVSRQVELMEANDDIGFVYSAYTMVDESGSPIWTHQPWATNHVRSSIDEFRNLILRDYVHSVTLVRKSCHDQIGVYDQELPECADWDLWLRLAANYSVGYIAEPLYAYRTHRKQMSLTLSARRKVTDERVRVVRRAFEALPPQSRRSVEHLQALAMRHALLRGSEIDCAQGFTSRSWEGLVDAFRRSPALLASSQSYKLLARLVLLTVVGQRRYNRLSQRIQTRRSRGPVAPGTASEDPIDEENGQERVRRDFEAFEQLVAQAERYLRRRRYVAAAVYAQVAALFAVWRHPGLFASPALERIVNRVGREALPVAIRASSPGRNAAPATPRRVLHVQTKAFAIGGHSRMMWRWIQQDAGRSHSVVLTRQGARPVPEELEDVVHAQGGSLHVLDRQRGNVLSWAKALRDIAASADVVVLHVHPDDTVPLLAFADHQHRPPVLYLDHADSVFWLGTSISDMVVALRDSGRRLAQERRGVEAERTALLPIVLPTIERTLTRSQAKEKLGIAHDAIVLLSIARGVKYAPLDGIAYPETLLPVLQNHGRAVLLAVGPDHTDEWQRVSDLTSGRARAFGHRTDTSDFYQAADIFLDSYPTVSITSLLEAGCYGAPLITRSPLPGEPGILGADAPGLMSHLILVNSQDEYTSVISRLIEDDEMRLRLGEETQQAIVRAHTEAAWQETLEEIYARAMALTPVELPSDAEDQMVASEVDIAWSHFFRNEIAVAEVFPYHMRDLPLDLRLKAWFSLPLKQMVSRPGLLLPAWVVWRLKSGIASVRTRRSAGSR